MRNQHLNTAAFAGGSFVFLVVVCLLVSVIGCVSKKQKTAQRPQAVNRYVMAMRAYDSGDRQAAIANLRAAVRENPNLTMARRMLADLYRAAEDYATAVEHYEAVTRLDPYAYDGHYNLGLTYQFLNRLQDAAASYLRALKLNPRDVKSNMNLGLVYLALNQPNDAVQYTERATAIDPKSAAAFANLGVALDAQGSYARAEAAYRKSLELDSTQTSTMLNLGGNLIAQRKADQAVAVLEQLVAKEDSDLTRKRYGDALGLARRYEEAIAQYELALKHNPQYFPAMNEMGRVLIAQYKHGLELDDEQRTAALDIWQKSLALNPNQPRIQALMRQWNQQGLFSR